MSQDNSMISMMNETSQGVTLNVKKPSMRYLNEFLRLNCAEELIALKLFPNVKEITESFAAFRAAQQYLSEFFPLDDPEVELFAVADGKRPTTAALFAFRTKWKCFSIDPQLQLSHPAFEVVERLYGWNNKVEQCSHHGKKAIIVAIHSHANLLETYKSLKALKTGIIAIPCCKPLDLETRPHIKYFDWGIHSPKREVKIWKPLVIV